MTSDGVLILSHCGFSFAEDLVTAARARGLAVWILSSRPLPEAGEARLAALRELADEVFSTDSHELGTRDVENAIASLRDRGRRIRGCISVWEGYRALMAYANALQGIADLPWGRIDALRDKRVVRARLHAAGLSRATARKLTPETLEALARDGGRYFVKPARGIASYGAFRLAHDTTWGTLQEIAAKARADTVYTALLGSEIEFIAEDYIPGREFSFEVLVADARAFVVGIHEKCQLTERDGTVLEDSCTSPPHSLSGVQTAAGIAWIRAVLAQLDLDWGCFHIEARFDGERWDLIEVNPRVGGSLISRSVLALNGRASVLDLWLDQLLSQQDGKASPPYLDTLETLSYRDDGSAPTDQATFFRVYFALPGRIERIDVEPSDPLPIVTQVLLKAGDEIEPAAREVFLGQILWQLPRARRDRELPRLLEQTAGTLGVRYESAPNLIGA
ncbi:ATP-grasp domain-containing protein [Burkholderia gladioli]|uniref:ATP-grasp domain-containing protein n=1 Tax=Burkholderia gladioli TaxID=28095 RepID=UPI001C2254E9|nr:ATP-grasp domain-containing protein [Burkholderia gladioli]MBU9216796.1 ATP-grasp domain-containing protein [Burkholderia gladioli]MDN7722021.1 ATP-grasp domain-containing protein [Burkholderia gladioli]